MSKQKLIRNLILKAVFAVITVAAYVVVLNLEPIINNELAMTQLENSNELYLMYELYNFVKPLVATIFVLIIALVAGSACYNVYKYFSTKKNGDNIK